MGVALLLSVPVFILVLGPIRLLAAGLEAVGLASLRPLLLLQFRLQFLLLAGFAGGMAVFEPARRPARHPGAPAFRL